MNGFKVVGATTGQVIHSEYTSHGAIAKGDLVVLKTDGQVEPSAAGNAVLGVAINAATGAGQKVTVARGNRLRVLGESDEVGDLMAADMVGARVDITGGTGAQKVDISTAAQAGTGADTGQLIVVRNNPEGYGFDTDTKLAILEIIEQQ